MPVQIFDDDAGFGNRAVARLVAQNGNLPDRPETQEIGARLLVGEIDEAIFEGRPVLVEGDQHLVAEGGKRMLVKNERHALTFPEKIRSGH